MLVGRAYKDTRIYTLVKQAGEYLQTFVRGDPASHQQEPAAALMSYLSTSTADLSIVREVEGPRSIGRPAAKR